MAIINKNRIPTSFTDFASNVILNSGNLPIVTTDEVATAIQVDEDGDATGFTSLTDHNCSKSCSSQVIS